MEYKKCLVELDAVLEHLTHDELIKIPEDIRNSIKDKKDKEYEWEYDTSKKLHEQKLSRDTIAMLSYLNMNYLLDDEQKELIHELHKLNEEKSQKNKKYSFDNKIQTDAPKYQNKVDISVEVKQIKWYEKVWLFFENIIKRKN